MRLEVGKPIRCTDGPFGELADVVIDPLRRRVTHLGGAAAPRRSAPPGSCPSTSPPPAPGTSEIRARLLRPTTSDRFPTVQESSYLRTGEVPVGDAEWDVGVEDVLAMPYYSSMGLTMEPGGLDSPIVMTYDRIPKGEVEIRRSSQVISADGHGLGTVEAFLVDGDDITHIVLERGHLWGRRDVTIPIGAVARVETDSVTLTLSKDQVGTLPSTRVHRWGA